MKIAVIGYSRCGKSTLSKYLSEIYDIPLLYMDVTAFQNGWQMQDHEII